MTQLKIKKKYTAYQNRKRRKANLTSIIMGVEVVTFPAPGLKMSHIQAFNKFFKIFIFRF
ncbi:hypothetical protein FM120_28785 [Sphingobacterium faecium PCAi_F2.5]|nr:hypothetical protein FM120_28785 [Sphingobacterium faecium PCAi_F2.5]